MFQMFQRLKNYNKIKFEKSSGEVDPENILKIVNFNSKKKLLIYWILITNL